MESEKWGVKSKKLKVIGNSLTAGKGDPIMAKFVAQLAPVNALADVSPVFVWRLQIDSGDATSLKLYADDLIWGPRCKHPIGSNGA